MVLPLIPEYQKAYDLALPGVQKGFAPGRQQTLRELQSRGLKTSGVGMYPLSQMDIAMGNMLGGMQGNILRAGAGAGFQRGERVAGEEEALRGREWQSAEQEKQREWQEDMYSKQMAQIQQQQSKSFMNQMIGTIGGAFLGPLAGSLGAGLTGGIGGLLGGGTTMGGAFRQRLQGYTNPNAWMQGAYRTMLGGGQGGGMPSYFSGAAPQRSWEDIWKTNQGFLKRG